MANRVVALFIPFVVLFGGSFAFPQNEPTGFDLKTSNPLAQMCLKNAISIDTFERIMMSFNMASDCFGENAASSKYSADAKALQQAGCPLREQDRTCLDPTIDLILSCLTRSRKQNRVVLDKVAYGVIQIKCDVDLVEHSSKPKYNLSNYSRICMRNQVASLMNCEVPFFGKSIILSDYDARECVQLTKSKACVMNILRTCDADSLIEIVDMLYNAVYAGNDCNRDIGCESNENEI